MPSNLTKSQVYNLALDTIREAPVQNQLASSPPINWLNRNFDHVRDLMIRSYTWNFAKEYKQLNADGTNPEWGWRRRYALPNNWLRVLPLTDNGDRRGRPVPHEIVGNWLMTDCSGPLRVRLMMRIEETGQWDPLFTEAVASRLALGMANKFTGKNKYIELAQQNLKAALDKAEEIDAFEGSAEPLDVWDIIDARSR